MSSFTARFLIGLVVIAVLTLVFFVPTPQTAPDGTSGRFSRVQVMAMTFADGRIESAWEDGQDGLKTGLTGADGGCRSQQKMKAIAERLSADAATVQRFQGMGLPKKSGQYAQYAKALSDRAQLFHDQSENCQP